MQIWTKTSTGSIAAVLIRRILAGTNFPAPRGCEFTVTHIPLVQFNSIRLNSFPTFKINKQKKQVPIQSMEAKTIDAQTTETTTALAALQEDRRK